jgi:hypothetical protein
MARNDDKAWHPYASLPKQAFWRTAVGEKNALQITDLWQPKAPLTSADRVATFGSCFAQHIGRAMAQRGFNWFDGEPGPEGVGPSVLRDYNYGIFSARTANIYTTKSLLQWVRWALEIEKPPTEVWGESGAFRDPFRPTIEPSGFASVEELRASRAVTLRALKDLIKNASLFVFTLGLTESWENIKDGYAYAACPGTLGGVFSESEHRFVNYGFHQVYSDLMEALRLIFEANPKIRVLLTVSPVPLTATASGEHVLVSTTYSKSVLRAVAGQAAAESPQIDYFPSYEIITGIPFRSMFYDPNLRTVAPEGVSFVMDSFFKALQAKFGDLNSVAKPVEAAIEPEKASPQKGEPAEKDNAQVVCEEEMLAAFAPGQLRNAS